MGRTKIIVLLLTSLFYVSLEAQTDSVGQSAFKYTLGLHITLSQFSAPSIAAQGKVSYNKYDLAIKYGKNNACIKNIKTFDELQVEGEWTEINFGVVIPVYKGIYASGLHLGLGFGMANTQLEFREVFTSLPPYSDYVYKENYTINNQKYLSASCGGQFYINEHFYISTGVLGFFIWKDTSVEAPIQLTPFSGRLPVGIYSEVSYTF